MILLFYQEWSFRLNFYSEVYENTIFEIPKNEKNILQINEITSYKNTKGIKQVICSKISFDFLKSDRSIKMDIVCEKINIKSYI